MTGFQPPSIVFQGTRWPSEALTGMAVAWRDALGARVESAPLTAMVMSNHPESVALFFALSSVSAPLALLPPDLEPWRSAPALPGQTRLVLLDRQRALEARARSLGVDTTVLAAAPPAASTADARFMTTPGLVLFTSGSTGRPRPLYRSTAALLNVARTLVATLGLRPGAGVITSLPLARAFGLNHGLMAAGVLRSPLALLDRFDHTALLRLFASREYGYWVGTPMMADVLGRCPLAGAHPAPPVCLIGGRLSADVVRRFRRRFGVSLRQGYGTTETGSIAVDSAPDAEVRSDTSGRPLPGVAVRIGDDPRAPVDAGTPGRIWLSAREYMMNGYGFPPDLEPAPMVAGWWASPDLGILDADGYLTVCGRLDDCFRTNAGHLVNPALVAQALEQYPGVVDAAVVPLPGRAGPVLGVLVESAERLSVSTLRGHLARSVPAWCQPRVIESTVTLPRLASGRIDRRTCIAILEQALAGDGGADHA